MTTLAPPHIPDFPEKKRNPETGPRRVSKWFKLRLLPTLQGLPFQPQACLGHPSSPCPQQWRPFLFASWWLHQEPSEVLAVSHQHISVFLLSCNRRGEWDRRIHLEHRGGPQRKAPRDGRGGEWSLLHSWPHPSLCWAETDKPSWRGFIRCNFLLDELVLF